MIDIVGNIKIDESKPERIKYFVACIRSYLFLKDHCRFVLCIDGASSMLANIVSNELRHFDHYLTDDSKFVSYGKTYCDLLKRTRYNHVVNFMEDQFMVCDSVEEIRILLDKMKQSKVDVMKSSFFAVEQNSITCKEFGLMVDWGGLVFRNNEDFHRLYQRYYGSRYYIGVNFLTTKQFAKRFWNRDLGIRPHEYEVAKYSEEWKHTVMFPNFEFQCAIDDDHGEPNTCLLKRNDCDKWNTTWLEVKNLY